MHTKNTGVFRVMLAKFIPGCCFFVGRELESFSWRITQRQEHLIAELADVPEKNYSPDMPPIPTYIYNYAENTPGWFLRGVLLACEGGVFSA